MGKDLCSRAYAKNRGKNVKEKIFKSYGACWSATLAMEQWV